MAKIKSIKKKKYKGKVHDLTVKDVHAYNIEGLSVHNSAVGSLALYILGITKIDPLRYGLLFERFLNPERVSPPDVDIDFDYNRRGEIYDYIYRKYNQENCCKIGTYNSLQSKAVVRYCAKALDIGNDWKIYEKRKGLNPHEKVEMTKNSLHLADVISKQIPVSQAVDTSIKAQLKDNAAFREMISKYPKLLSSVKHLEGVLSSSGVHPAGIIICKDRIDKYIPLKDSKGQVCSQFDGPEVEELGLLKFDLLALKTLTVVNDSLQYIKERHDLDIDVDKLEPDDQAVFDMLNGKVSGIDNRGIFQFESDGISKLLRSIKVDTFEDMVVANALYRPGPLKAKVHELYADYKHGRKPIKPLHPKMGELLKDTYGIMVFQESFMKVAQELASFTKGQSDTMRKAVGKKNMKLLQAQRGLFINGCVKNGINSTIAAKIFEQIEYFGEYGFNKCLSGDTEVHNKLDGKTYSLEELEDGSYGVDGEIPITLDSYVDGEIIEDELVEVFETGEKEVFEIELENGMIIKCTLDHKFICSDGVEHTVEEIMNNNLEVLCWEEGISSPFAENVYAEL
jgi:DNA polymerase III subunit alpha